MLCTIDQRSAFDADHTTVCSYLIICTDGAGLHIETDDQFVTLFPASLDVYIAIGRDEQGHGDAIDDETVAEALAVGILIEVAGHHLVTQPTWDAHLQIEVTDGVLVDDDFRLAFPGVVGGLRESDLLPCHIKGGAVGEEEVQIDIMPLDGIDIAWQRGDETTDIARTAGTAEPRLTLVLSHRLEGIGIEEAVAFE